MYSHSDVMQRVTVNKNFIFFLQKSNQFLIDECFKGIIPNQCVGKFILYEKLQIKYETKN